LIALQEIKGGGKDLRVLGRRLALQRMAPSN
jgi:hypothetical protein